MSQLYLREDFISHWPAGEAFERARQQQGELYRNREGRRTLRFELDGQAYFLKYHAGIGWKQIISDICKGRQPVLGAGNEWQAIQSLERLGIDTMRLVAYGERGWNPARRESFIVTEALTETMSLEYLGAQWRAQAPTFATRLTLLRKIAGIARSLHEAGITHRDFYLCHFLLDERFAENNTITDSTRIHLIDLHRAQQWRQLPLRWRVKDLSALYFSARDVPLSDKDKWRFMRFYHQSSLRDVMKQHGKLWHKVEKKGKGLRARSHRHKR